MKLLFFFLVPFLSVSQTVLNWNTNNVAVGTFVPISSPDASVTISGTNFNNLQGPSPRYNTGYSGYSNWNLNGLGLGVDFPNTTSTVTVDVTFTNPACGSISFNVHDLDGSTSGLIFEDKIKIETWDNNNNAIPVNATNFTFGNSSFCGGAMFKGDNNSLNTRIGRCENGAYNANSYGSVGASILVTLKSPTDRIKRIKITYGCSKGSSPDVNAYYTGSNPDYENIVIGDMSLNATVLPALTISGTNTICNGQSTALSATGSYSNFVWSTSQTGASINVSPNSNTTYTVSGTLASGCVNSTTGTVSVVSPPAATVTADASVCAGGDITINGAATSGTSVLQYQFGGTGGAWTSLGLDVFNWTNAGPSGSTVYVQAIVQNSPCTNLATTPISIFIDPCDLPIELITFQGMCLDESKNFYWTTATEHNNNYFSLEHSSNGEQFSVAKQISASGTSTEVQEYHTTLNELDPRFNYYRLKQTDNDGAFTYSDVIYVGCTDRQVDVISVFPNPANSMMMVNFSNDIKEGNYSLFVMDLVGKIVAEQIVDVTKNGNAVVNVSSFSKGHYFLGLIDQVTNEQTTVIRFSKID